MHHEGLHAVSRWMASACKVRLALRSWGTSQRSAGEQSRAACLCTAKGWELRDCSSPHCRMRANRACCRVLCMRAPPAGIDVMNERIVKHLQCLHHQRWFQEHLLLPFPHPRKSHHHSHCLVWCPMQGRTCRLASSCADCATSAWQKDPECHEKTVSKGHCNTPSLHMSTWANLPFCCACCVGCWWCWSWRQSGSWWCLLCLAFLTTA